MYKRLRTDENSHLDLLGTEDNPVITSARHKNTNYLPTLIGRGI